MSSPVSNISDNVWKISADSNVYVLKLDEIIVIDTGRRANRELVRSYLDKIVPLSSVKKVIFTHLHYDHIGNFDLFPNAKFYASKQSIDDLEKSRKATIHDEDMEEKFSVDLIPIEDMNGLFVINTPGHTRGSICIWYKEKKIMFTGDTIFGEDSYGRTDLPTSVPGELQKSVFKISGYPIEIMCPGHDY